MGTRRGQALVELALGMFAMALVAASLVGFAMYIAKGLEMQRSLRSRAGASALNSVGGTGMYSSVSDHGVVEVEPLAAEYIFGKERVRVSEEVHIPKMGVMK